MTRDESPEKSVHREEQDRFMREKAQTWLFDHTIWHFERIGSAFSEPEHCEGMRGLWFVLGDAVPAQTTGLVLGLREGPQWDILVSQTFQQNEHTFEVIQERQRVLHATLHRQTVPCWSSDREDILPCMHHLT